MLAANWGACGGQEDDAADGDADADADADADGDADGDVDENELCRLACEHEATCVPERDADACLAGCLCYGVALVEPQAVATYLECSATVDCDEESSSYCGAQAAEGTEPSTAAAEAAEACAAREQELCPGSARLACNAVLVKNGDAVAAFDDCLAGVSCDAVLSCRSQAWRDLCQ